MEVKVSIIIPSYDRPNTLRQVIDSYLCQEGVEELIVIDDGSPKDYSETNQYIKNRLRDTHITYNYHKNDRNMGAGYCRNLGISLANGNYILWGEDDAFLSEGYLRTLIAKISDKAIMCGCIYYGIVPWMQDNILQNLIKDQQNSDKPVFDMKLFEGYYRKVVNKDIEVPFAHALILVPKDAYAGIKYFEHYRINGYREESDAQVQMVKNGFRIIFTSDTECYHFPSSETESGGQHKSGLIKQELYKIINTAIFYDRHYNFLKVKYNLKSTKFKMKLDFAINSAACIWSRAVKKIKRNMRL